MNPRSSHPDDRAAGSRNQPPDTVCNDRTAARSTYGGLRDHALSALLVLEALVLFVAAPAAGMGLRTPLYAGAAVLLCLMAVVVVISPGIWAKLLAVLAICLGAAGVAIRTLHPSPLTDWFGHGAIIVGMLAISLTIGRVVFAPGRVTYHRLEGAVALYLNIAVIFTAAFRLVADLHPGAFAHLPVEGSDAERAVTMLYFSFSTLTSTGFGEILPLHPAARSLANLEAVLGQLYLTMLVARLIGLHLETGRRRSPE